MVQVRVLGRCEADGVGLRFRQAELVGLLAVRRHGVSRAILAETLWPEAEPSVARHNLRQTLVVLRGGGIRCVVAQGETLVLEGVTVDLWEEEARLAGDFEPHSVDELLPSVRNDWIFPARAALTRQIVQSALRQGEAALPQTPERALAFAEMALEREPGLEASWSLRIRAHLARGDRRGAERTIAEFERQTGHPSRLRTLLKSEEEEPLRGLRSGALNPHEWVRLLTVAAPGLGSSARKLIEEALHKAQGVTDEERAAAQAAIANLALEDGDLVDAERRARGGLPHLSARLALIRVLIRSGRLDEAETHFPERLDDLEAKAAFGVARGVLYHYRHAFPEADRTLREALRHAQAVGCARLVAKARFGVASAALWRGKNGVAERELQAGLAETPEALPADRARFEMTVGRLREQEGKWIEARTAYARAIESIRAAGDPWALAQALTHSGDLTRRAGSLTEAETFYREAIALRRGIGDRLGLATALKGLGQTQGTGGEAALKESLESYLAGSDPLGGAAAHLALGRLLRDLGRPEEALEHARRAVERLDRMQADGAGLATDDSLSPDAAQALLAELEKQRDSENS